MKRSKKSLVVYVTDEGKMMALNFVNANFIKWGKNFTNGGNPCMLKNVVNFGKPSVQFFWAKLKLCTWYQLIDQWQKKLFRVG